MKKIVSILLLTVMLFNIGGYRVLISFLEQKATKSLDIHIDNNAFDESTLVEVKIPLNMPYYSDRAYETAYGETEINSKKYKFVKRKIEQNILYLLCLPHTEKDQLNIKKSNLDYSQNGSNKDKQNTNSCKIFQFDGINNTVSKTYIPGVSITIEYGLYTINGKPLILSKKVEQPPEIA